MPTTLTKAKSSGQEMTGKELTGRKVLLILLAFFGVVFAANGIMARYAVQTFRGLANDSAYSEGLAYDKDIKAAHDQDALGWKVNGALTRLAPGHSRIVVTQLDRDQKPSENISVNVLFEHPVDRVRDKTLALTMEKPGVYSGEIEIERGQWGLELQLTQNGQPIFHSQNRVQISDANAVK